MKTLSFSGKKVKDVTGLYYDLLDQHFEVENVAVGGDCTYVYIHDAEDKDPAVLVDAWIGKAPPDSKNAIAEREKMALRVTAAAQEERAAKAAARAAAAAAAQDSQKAPEELGIESLFLTGPEGESEAPKKEGLWSKIFKVFRS